MNLSISLFTLIALWCLSADPAYDTKACRNKMIECANKQIKKQATEADAISKCFMNSPY